MEKPATRQSLDREELESLLTLALDEARARGVDQAEVSASHDMRAVRYRPPRRRRKTLNTPMIAVSASRSTRIHARAVPAPRIFRPAQSGRQSPKPARLPSSRRAIQYAGLADAELMCKEIRNLDLDHPWNIEAADAIALAIETEAAALAFDKRISNSEGATVSTNRGSRAYGNTHGFLGSYSRSSHSITAACARRSGWCDAARLPLHGGARSC